MCTHNTRRHRNGQGGFPATYAASGSVKHPLAIAVGSFGFGGAS